MAENIIEIRNLNTGYGRELVHRHLNLDIKRGEILAILGDSGCGKTTLLRSILMLQKPISGMIRLFDTDILTAGPREIEQVKQRWGVLFQKNALFGSLTVLENIVFLLNEFTNLSPALQREVALLKIVMVGLSAEVGNLYPAELSGGMQKRAALARAIALDPELLFFDEPTAGLDSKSAEDLDGLVLELRESLGLTIIMISHELNSLWHVPDRVAFMGEGKILEIGTMHELMQSKHPAIQKYFSGHYSAVYKQGMECRRKENR